jgi:cytochrome c-type biogenesis protein CcmH/NrfG
MAAIPVEKQILDSPAPPFDGEVAGENTGRHEYESPESKTGIIGKIVGSVLLLLIGSVIGLVSYHYLLANRTPETVAQPNTEMQSSNQQLTAFEDNRRYLDKDPEALLKRLINEPKDAENSYLVGRAYLLTGKFPEARKSFSEALELIAAGKVDPNNAKTIQTDISIAMTIANDPLTQKNLKKELDDPKSIAIPAGNGNRPAAR